MAVKMQLLFDGFKDLAADIDRIGGDLDAAVDEALIGTADTIHNNLVTAAASYASKGGGKRGYATGAMYSTIIGDNYVNWMGSIASIDVGFRIRQTGGWHSIFVMYGTPKMAKDTAVYNAIKGAATQAQIKKLQEEIMMDHLALAKR